MIEVESIGGQVVFDGQAVIIRRTSRMAKSALGNADTIIPIGHIGAVEWTEPRWYKAGHIRFAIAGSQSAASPTPVNRDRNAVIFGKKELPAFEKLRMAVQDALSR